MAPKDEELRPVMTRIPERLRRRLEREARWHRRSMNAEIIHRLQASFDIPDQAAAIASDITGDMDSGFDDVHRSLNEVQSQIRAILSHLGLSDPVEEARARKAEGRKARMEEARPEEIQRAVEAMEKQGFKVVRIPKQTDKNDNGEKQ
jgi:hypothetical protein